MSEIAGLDFSTARPAPATLARAGFTFALGYLKPLVNGQPSIMELRPADVTGYPAAGVQLGAVWETGADRALSGAAGGAADAATARARAAAIGYPTSAVIFAAVDFAVTAAQLPAVHAYLDAFSDNVGHPGGSYGSYTLVEARAARRPGEWLWQTAAWSGGLLSAHAHLYQRAAPSGHWPVIPGTDENVLCHPLPLLGGTIDMTPDEMISALVNFRPNRNQNLWDAASQIQNNQSDIVNALTHIQVSPADPQAIAAAVVQAIQALPAPAAQETAALVLEGLNGASLNVTAPAKASKVKS